MTQDSKGRFLAEELGIISAGDPITQIDDAPDDDDEEDRSVIRSPYEPEQVAAFDYWKQHDELQQQIGAAWLTDYMDAVWLKLQSMIATDLNVMDVSLLLDQFTPDLMEAWIGTPDNPGPMLAMALAGMAAGQASLAGSAGNPDRPAALRANVVLDVDWGLISQEALDFIRTYLPTLIRAVNATTLEATRTAIEAWIQSGEPLSRLTDALEAVYHDRNRARLIAQDQSTIVYNEGAFKRWQNAGVSKARWIDSNDSHICPQCKRLDGQVADIRAGWVDPLTGKTYRASAHPGCRCFRKPVLE